MVKSTLADDHGHATNDTLFSLTKAVLFFGVAQNVMLPVGVEPGGSDEMIKLWKDSEWLASKCDAYDRLVGSGEAVWKEGWFLELAEGGEAEIGKAEGSDESGGKIRLGKTHGAMVKFPGEYDEDWEKVEMMLHGLDLGV